MSKAVAFLAGLGAGYMDSQRKKKDDERQAARDARDDEVYKEGRDDRAAARAERDQGIADKNAIRTAAAPVAVSETASQPMPAEAGNPSAMATGSNPTVGGYRVGAKDFADKGVAQTEADAQNTPGATRSRVSAAMMAQGNVLGADQLRTSGLQADAAEGTLKEQKDLQGQREFARGVAGAIGTGGWGGFAKFATEKYNDDNTYVATEDGKGGAIIVSTDKAGKEVGRKAFVTPEEAIMFSVGRADPTKWAEYKAGRDDKTAAQDATKRGLDIQQQNADTNEQYRKDMVKNQRDQMAMTERHQKAVLAGKAQPGAAIQVGLKDMRDFEGDLDKYIKDQYPVKDGADPKERGLMNAQATQLKANGSSIFQNNAAIGIPLTAGTVLQALELTKDPKNVVIAEGSGGLRFRAVVVNGQQIAVSGPLQKAGPANGAGTPPAAAVPSTAVPPQAAVSAQPPPNMVNPNSAAAMAARGQLMAGQGWK